MTVFYRCDFRGAQHLCVTMFDGPRGGGVATGSFSRIIDSAYEEVLTIAPSYKYKGSNLTMDMHEFNLVSNGTSALLSSYVTIQRPTTFPNCRSFRQQTIPEAKYIKVGMFTEVSTDGKNSTLFVWNPIDHMDLEESLLCPGDFKGGSGRSHTDPFDFFHINSVDKNNEGDYLVSARHTSTVYKIAGIGSPSGLQPGTIIWRLGGKFNNFKLTNSIPGSSGAFNFSFQHHARFTEGGVRLWDNANSEAAESERTTHIDSSADASSGMDIKLDEGTGTATLIYQAIPPSQALDHSQGSHQLLPNSNHLCGLGSTNEVFERTSDGALALDARIGQMPIGSYRAAKYEWTGQPSELELALFAYAHNDSTANVFYVSWNGATRVDQYRFFTSNSSTTSFVETAMARKGEEFETTVVGGSFGWYAYAEARDAEGEVLGFTPTVRTFVPDISHVEMCDQLRCPPHTDYELAGQPGAQIQFKYVHAG